MLLNTFPRIIPNCSELGSISCTTIPKYSVRIPVDLNMPTKIPQLSDILYRKNNLQMIPGSEQCALCGRVCTRLLRSTTRTIRGESFGGVTYCIHSIPVNSQEHRKRALEKEDRHTCIQDPYIRCNVCALMQVRKQLVSSMWLFNRRVTVK